MQEAGSSSTNSPIRNDPQCSAFHISNVNTSCPAKKITFFRSGDAQFRGVRMAIHTRNFKCFDALLDDLSQKVPLPFGVRTITTPKGTHPIRCLDELEDGGCYICSDRQHVKPVDVEAAKRPAVWHKSNPHSSWMKPTRPQEPPMAHSGQHYHRHPKRIILTKNTDPAMRRSIALNRRISRNLGVFLGEVSEIMQYQVRKLYTLEGRKIDSIQSLMQCPSELVCVGREPFKALLPETLGKHAEDKLPGMSTRSRASNCSEGHESKKNVNFGLETKKSIIHPRLDSSNKSTRFSLSSGKSNQNGLCATPGQSACVSTCQYPKEVVLNDDIEKRVLVNKDGSLSVEMKVRFRLVNDETLHWSTEIKKSGATQNKSSVKERVPYYLQAKPEYSDLESSSACEVEEGEEEFSTKPYQKYMDESYCQNCSNHCQEYDIWKNPMDNGGGKTHSSSFSTRKIKHKKPSADSVRTLSRSSEEYTKHVVEETSCFQMTADEREKWIQYCSVSRCCSQCEVSTTKVKSHRNTEDTYDSDTGYKHHCNADGKPNTVDYHDSFCDPDSFEVTKYHPDSAISNSSKILKEGQCDDDNLPPSASRACAGSQTENLAQYIHSKICQASENVCLSPRPPSNTSSCSAHSSKHKTYRNVHPLPTMPQQWKDHADTYRTDSAGSAVSNVCSRSKSCPYGVTSPRSLASGMHIGYEEGIQAIMCRGIKVCNESRSRTNSPRAAVSDAYNADEVQAEETEYGIRFMNTMSANAGFFSGQYRKSTEYPCCSGCENAGTTESKVSELAQHMQAQEVEDVDVKSLGDRSPRIHGSDAIANHTHCVLQRAFSISDVLENAVQNNVAEAVGIKGCSESVLSNLSKRGNNSNVTSSGKSSEAESMCSENAGEMNVDERTKSDMSVKSNCIVPDGVPTSGQEIQKADEVSQNEGTVSLLSDRSNGSVRCSSLYKSHYLNSESAIKAEDGGLKRTKSPVLSPNNTEGANMFQELRMGSAMSNKSNSSSKSSNNQKSVIPSPTAPHKTYNRVMEVITQEPAASSKPSRISNTLSEKLKKSQQNVPPTELSETEHVSGHVSETESKGRVREGSSPERPHKLDDIPDAASALPPTRPSKCPCSSHRKVAESNSKNHDVCVQTMACDPSEYKSARSTALYLCDQSGEPFSPTSTASISLGLGEEDKHEDLSERSISSMSQNLEEEKCLLEISKSAALDCVPNSSGDAKPSSSMSSALSQNSKKSHVSQDHFKSPKQAFSLTSAITSRSVCSAKSKAEKAAASPLNDSRHNVASGWSGSKDHCAKKSPSSYLEITGTKRISDCNIDTSSIQSLKNSKADKKEGQTSKTNSMTKTDVSQNSQMPVRNMIPEIFVRSLSDSVLSHTPSAANPLREKASNSIPDSRGSNRSNTSGKKYTLVKVRNSRKCEKNSSSKNGGKTLLSQNKNRDQGLELMPSNLPNASPVEVVNDWLRKIPADGSIFEMGDEFNVPHNEAVHVNAEGSLRKEIRGTPENVIQTEELQEIGWPAGKVKQDVSVISDETLTCNETSQTIADITHSDAPENLNKRETLPKRCQSSVQVMKVLISPKLDRFNSLPEVSSTYGKKLSSSAKELLDCLINNQLIDSKKDKDDKYNEILSILQSLWIVEPSESEQDKHRITDNGSAEDEFNLRSSSGIDVSSGSLGSGRVSVFGGAPKSDTAQGRITPIAEQEPSMQIYENTGKEDEHDSPTPANDGPHTSSQSITPDIAERVRCSPEEVKRDGELQEVEGHVKEIIQSENQKEGKKKSATFHNTCCRNYSSRLNLVVEKETDKPGNTDSGTGPSIQRDAFRKKASQDPDPVWIFSLLKKLEKQFMSHYASAVEEFKVKWDLNDSETLDTMIRELKEEVHKRIQTSINHELQKIQSRAGRASKPLISTLSRDFTAETDQRRGRLKVMRNKSISPFLSKSEINPVSSIEFSDQRSEDEYCPCDTCMKKMTVPRVVQCTENQMLAPVMMDFDLRKILQTKKDPPVSRPTESLKEDSKKESVNYFEVQEKNNLEVVEEEAEVQHDMRRQSGDLSKAKEGVTAAGDAVQTKDETSAEEESGETDKGGHKDGGEAVEEEHPDGEKGTGGEQTTGPAAGEGEGWEERDAEEGMTKEDRDTNDQGKGSKNKGAASDVDDVAEGEARQAEAEGQGGRAGDVAKDQDTLAKEAGTVEGRE